MPEQKISRDSSFCFFGDFFKIQKGDSSYFYPDGKTHISVNDKCLLIVPPTPIHQNCNSYNYYLLKDEIQVHNFNKKLEDKDDAIQKFNELGKKFGITLNSNTPKKDDIKDAYKKLSLKYYPVKNDGNNKSFQIKERKFKELHDAYEILTSSDEISHPTRFYITL